MGTAFEKEALPRLKQIENLRSVVANDLMEGVRFLERIIVSLEKYSEVNAPGGVAPAAIQTTAEPEGGGE
jgi:hypothetical protein